MAEAKRQTGHGSGEVRIGPVTVAGRWRFSYRANPAPSSPDPEDLKFTVNLTIAERKKLANLKKGDGASLTAGPFLDLAVTLQDLDYDDGNGRVSVTFVKS
jgi:hypothetical protein